MDRPAENRRRRYAIHGDRYPYLYPPVAYSAAESSTANHPGQQQPRARVPAETGNARPGNYASREHQPLGRLHQSSAPDCGSEPENPRCATGASLVVQRGFATELGTTPSLAPTRSNCEALPSQRSREGYTQEQGLYRQYPRVQSGARDHRRAEENRSAHNGSRLDSLNSSVTPTHLPPRLRPQPSGAPPSEAQPFLCSPPFGAPDNRGFFDCVNYIPGEYCAFDPFQAAEATDPNNPRPGHYAGSYTRQSVRHSSPQPVSSFSYSQDQAASHLVSRSEGSNARSTTKRQDKWASLLLPVQKFASRTRRHFSSSKPSSVRNRLVKRSRSKTLPGNLKPVAEEAETRPAMNSSQHLDPATAMAAITKQKAEAMRLAREQGAAVAEMCRRAKTDPPQYSFQELIGKGAYGRVYKGRQIPSQKIVAIKVLDIDKLDYDMPRDNKDESIKDFIHETKVMQRVKDSGAKNVNQYIEAFSIQTQLWLVCEYCPGGSVKTLMRATGNKLEERYIVPIARELAEGLRAIHDAGILHRDVKAANVLIHEDGQLQICDFGVAGILQSQADKRSTWIGTPHWMPPEMFAPRGENAYEYSSEIDVWAYGCTLFECATGNPPNANLRERMQIGRQLNRFPPKLDGEGYSDELRDLVSFCLDSDPKTRPSMQDILQHSYVSGSQESHPTESLRQLVARYYQWLQVGGQRVSLFNPGGAAAAEMPEDGDIDRASWNFSTTDGFQRRFSILNLDEISESLEALEAEKTPTAPYLHSEPTSGSPVADYTPEQKANFDERVRRGAVALEGLFDESKPDYKYETKRDFVPIEEQRPKPRQMSSDLPLRNETDRSSVTSTLIDINLGDFESAHYAAGMATQDTPFQLADADTIRANRSSRSLRNSSSGGSERDADLQTERRGPRPPTMEWTFPSMETTAVKDDRPASPEPGPVNDAESPFGGHDKRDTRTWTFPVMTPDEGANGDHAEGSRRGSDASSTDLPSRFPSLQPAPLSTGRRAHGAQTAESRPSTSRSAQSSASDVDYDPFKFDRPGPAEETGYFPNLSDADTYAEADDTSRGRSMSPAGHPAFASESSSTYSRPRERRATAVSTSGSHPSRLRFPDIAPPRTEALMEDATPEMLTAELDRMLGNFTHALGVLGEGFARYGEGGEDGRPAEQRQPES